MDPKLDRTDFEEYLRAVESDTESSEISETTECDTVQCVGISPTSQHGRCDYSSSSDKLLSETFVVDSETLDVSHDLPPAIVVAESVTLDPANGENVNRGTHSAKPIKVADLFKNHSVFDEKYTKPKAEHVSDIFSTNKNAQVNFNDVTGSVDNPERNKNLESTNDHSNIKSVVQTNNSPYYDSNFTDLKSNPYYPNENSSNKKVSGIELTVVDQPFVVNHIVKECSTREECSKSIAEDSKSETKVFSPNSEKKLNLTEEEGATSEKTLLQTLFTELETFRQNMLGHVEKVSESSKASSLPKQTICAIDKYSKMILSSKIRLLQCKSDVQLFMNILDLFIRIIASAGKTSVYDSFMYFHMDKGLYYTATEIRSDLVCLNNKLNVMERNLLKSCSFAVSESFVIMPKFKKGATDSTMACISGMEKLENEVFSLFKAVRKFLRRCKSKSRYKVEFASLHDKLTNSVSKQAGVEPDDQSEGSEVAAGVPMAQPNCEPLSSCSEQCDHCSDGEYHDPCPPGSFGIGYGATEIGHRFVHVPLYNPVCNHFHMPTTLCVPSYLAPSARPPDFAARYPQPPALYENAHPNAMCVIRTPNQQMVLPVTHQFPRFFAVSGMNIFCKNGVRYCTCNLPFIGVPNQTAIAVQADLPQHCYQAAEMEDLQQFQQASGELEYRDPYSEEYGDDSEDTFGFLQEWPRTYPQTISKENPKKCFESLVNIVDSSPRRGKNVPKKPTKPAREGSDTSKKFRWLKYQMHNCNKKYPSRKFLNLSESKVRSSLGEISRLAFEVNTIFTTYVEDIVWVLSVLDQSIISMCNDGNLNQVDGILTLHPDRHTELHKIAVAFRSCILSKKNDMVGQKKMYCSFLHTSYEDDSISLDIDELNSLGEKRDNLLEAEVVLEKIKIEVNEISEFFLSFLKVYNSTFPHKVVEFVFHNFQHPRIAFELGS